MRITASTLVKRPGIPLPIGYCLASRQAAPTAMSASLGTTSKSRATPMPSSLKLIRLPLNLPDIEVIWPPSAVLGGRLIVAEPVVVQPACVEI